MNNNELKRCTMCRSTILLSYFDLNRKGEYYKSCRNCLKSQRDRRATNKAKEYIKNRIKEEEAKICEEVEYLQHQISQDIDVLVEPHLEQYMSNLSI